MRRTPRRLVVAGSVLVDILLYLDSPPAPGSAAVARRSLVTVGAGYNLLAGAARLGLPAACASLVGSGPFGSMVRQALGQIGVPMLLPDRDGDTGFDVGLVAEGSDRQTTFVGSRGVEATLTRADLEGVVLRPGDAVCVSGYDLTHEGSGGDLAGWASALDESSLLVFDPGPMLAEIPCDLFDAILARTDVLSLNLVEATALTAGTEPSGTAAGEPGPAATAARVAVRLRTSAWEILRAGAGGCWVARRGGVPVHVPGRPAAVVDTTGAGDAHLAALLARLAAGDGVVRAASWANVAASLAVERAGSSVGPSAGELAAAMERFAEGSVGPGSPMP